MYYEDSNLDQAKGVPRYSWRGKEDDVKYSPEPAHENILRFY